MNEISKSGEEHQPRSENFAETVELEKLQRHRRRRRQKKNESNKIVSVIERETERQKSSHYENSGKKQNRKNGWVEKEREKRADRENTGAVKRGTGASQLIRDGWLDPLL